jgi:two-component system, sensor histidine kinase and response regulator
MAFNIKILIVDDNQENLYSMKNLLETDEYQFILASSGEAALQSAIKKDIALILLDVQMPGMDGYEVARILKSNKKTEGIPIIFITAIDHDIDNIVRGLDIGALDFIFKPVNPLLLRAKVRNFVSLHTAQSELVKLNNELEEKVFQRTKELEIRNQELKKMNEILDNFLHVSAHDFRNPLSNISLISQIFKTTKSDDERNLLLNNLETSINMMEKTIKGIIEMVEVQEHKNHPAKEIHFDELLIGITDEFHTKDEIKAAIKFCFNETPYINYIPVYLESVLRNLISNSFKYRSPSRPLEIDIKTKTEGDFVVITFTDNGIGIDLKRNRNNLFKPFSRFNKEIDGKGIGLHIIKNIVEMNGGHIFVSSLLDSGTTFYVYLKPYITLDKQETHTVVG